MDNLKQAIEKDNAQRKAEERKQLLRELCRENPYSKEHWNLTRQMEAENYDPNFAKALEACKDGGTLPGSMVDDLPPYLRSAVVSVVKECAGINDEANGNKTGEEA